MRKLFVVFGLIFVMSHLSCSLNPLNGLLNNISVQISSVPDAMKVKATAVRDIHSLAVPSTVPTQAADFDCIAFSVTGYGIDEKPNVEGSEVPIEKLRLGLETVMQAPSAGAQYTVQVPSLLGVDPRLQKRLVQIIGVFTSLADKTSCRGNNLSDFLTGEDPNAAVYVIGSGYYPSEDSGACSDEADCIVVDDAIARSGAGPELIYSSLFQERIAPEYVFTSFQTVGPTVFSDSDLYNSAFSSSVNSSLFESKPQVTSRIARIDYYFALTDYIRTRAGAGVRLEFTNITAPEYGVNGSLCDSTPTGVFSDVRFKIWDSLNGTWMNPPRLNSSSTLDISPANSLNGLGYSIPYLNVADSSVHTETINGKAYLIVSMRSLEPNCSSVKSGYTSLNFL